MGEMAMARWLAVSCLLIAVAMSVEVVEEIEELSDQTAEFHLSAVNDARLGEAAVNGTKNSTANSTAPKKEVVKSNCFKLEGIARLDCEDREEREAKQAWVDIRNHDLLNDTARVALPCHPKVDKDKHTIPCPANSSQHNASATKPNATKPNATKPNATR